MSEPVMVSVAQNARKVLHTLRLDGVQVSRRALHGRYSIDDLWFSTSVWYDSVDFDLLRERYGTETVRRIAFHVVAFELNKLASLRPAIVDWGCFKDLATVEFQELWLTLYTNVWAQWRFENDAWDYHGPVSPQGTVSTSPTIVLPEFEVDAEVLAFCGGGKDSLLAMELLREINVEFDTLTYASSIYGRSTPQHELVDRLLRRSAAIYRRQQWISDDFLDFPVPMLRPEFGVKTVTAAETPSSIFAALPFVLQHGYRSLCVAHERSAEAYQARSRQGEPINHQWAKCFEAEQAIDIYIRRHLVENLSYFSILKPIHDVCIFGALRRYQAEVPLTHSCNLVKPWCAGCAKCLYVWMGYAAFLDKSVVEQTFGAIEPLKDSRNLLTIRQLAGLEDRRPFECVGEADEAALYLLMCRARGYRGVCIDHCAKRLNELQFGQVIQKYCCVDFSQTKIPASIAKRLRPVLETMSFETTAFINSVLCDSR